MSTSRPSLPELRAVAQAGIVDRRSAEHWAGRLYMRWVSLRVTRLLVTTPITPDALTLLMIAVGLVAALVIGLWPGVLSAVVAALLVQLYLLLDCVDGEVARWIRRTSARGVYLDRLGHHVVEAAIVLGLGWRAAGGPNTTPSWWLVLGAVTALVVVLGKLESDLVTVARAGAGLPPTAATDPESRLTPVRTLRRALSLLPVHRLVGAIELSLFVVVAAVLDASRGDLVATRGLLVGVAGVALVVAVGHPVTILTSGRLR